MNVVWNFEYYLCFIFFFLLSRLLSVSVLSSLAIGGALFLENTSSGARSVALGSQDAIGPTSSTRKLGRFLIIFTSGSILIKKES